MKPVFYLTRRRIAEILRAEARGYENSHRWQQDGKVHDVEIIEIIAALRAAAKIVTRMKK